MTVTADPLQRNPDRWVPAMRFERMPTPPIDSNVTHEIDVVPNSRAEIRFHTSAVDRAWGFLIASVPLYGAFALGVTLMVVALWSVPLLSFAAFLIYWLSFVAAWLSGYVYTLAVSAEGIAFWEARQKWHVIKEEQRRRWEHFDRLTGQRLAQHSRGGDEN